MTYTVPLPDNCVCGHTSGAHRNDQKRRRCSIWSQTPAGFVLCPCRGFQEAA